MTFPLHLYDEARSFAAYCSGVALLIALAMLPWYSSGRIADYALQTGLWVSGAAALYILFNTLAFIHQGAFRRAIPQLAGVACPGGATALFATGHITLIPWLAILLLCLPLWAGTYLLSYRISAQLERSAIASRALAHWDRHVMGTDPSREVSGQLLSVAPQTDPWWSGTIAGSPATFASRVTWFTPTAIPVGAASHAAHVLRWAVVAFLTKQRPDDDHQELLVRPASWFTVDLPPSTDVVPDFRVVSRLWIDRDIVFGNVRDREETFESLELGGRYSVRVRADADRLRAWQVFNVDLLERLIDAPHFVIAKEGLHLAVLRLHGCATPEDVDRLHDFTAGLVTGLARIR